MKNPLTLRRMVLGLLVLSLFLLSREIYRPQSEDESITSRQDRNMIHMPAFRWKGETVEGCKLEICDEERRSALLHENCEGHEAAIKDFKPHNPASYYRFIYDDKHKVLFCAVTKSLTTSFYRMFYEAVTGKRLDFVQCRKCWFDQQLGWLDRLPIKEIEKRLDSYYKVMLVRHPLDRLRLSWKRGLASHDANGPTMREVGKKILRKSRDLTDDNELEEALMDGVDFEEFLEYVNDVEMDANSEHHRAWMPMHQMCHPCAIKYDFVAKMETIHEDAAHILQKVNMSADISHLGDLIKTRGATVHNTVRRRLTEYDHIFPDTMDSIMEIYRHDFQLFDYHWDGETAACGHCSGDPKKRCC